MSSFLGALNRLGVQAMFFGISQHAARSWLMLGKISPRFGGRKPQTAQPPQTTCVRTYLPPPSCWCCCVHAMRWVEAAGCRSPWSWGCSGKDSRAVFFLRSHTCKTWSSSRMMQQHFGRDPAFRHAPPAATPCASSFGSGYEDALT